MWQGTSSTQQHRATNRSRRPSHSTPSRSSQQIWRQHQRQTGVSIQLAITGQCRTVPQNTDGTSECTQIATPTKLRHHHTLSTSSHAMGQTCGLPTQQVRHSLRRQHKLLQTLEQRQQTTTVWVWWNSTVHVSNSESPTQAWTTVCARHLVRQRHSNQRTSHRHHQQGDPSKNHQETTTTWEVQSTTDGCHQQKQSQQVCDSRTIHHTTTNDTQTTETTSWSDSHTDRGDSRSSRSRNNDNITSASASASQPDIPPPPPTTSTSPALTLPPQAIADPTSCHTRPAMPSPPKRTVSDTPAEGSSPKQQRTTTEATGPPRPETTTEPQTTKLRITKITVQTKRGGNHGILLWRCHRATNRKDPPRTNSEQHRRTRQGENNWRNRNETGDPLDEGTTSLHRGQHRLADPLTTKQHYKITMGVAWQRQQRESKNCGKRLHRGSNRSWRDLCLNTHLLRTTGTSHAQLQQRLDCENRRHLHSILTRKCSNTRLLHVPTSRVLQPNRLRGVETQQGHIRPTQQPKRMAETPCGSPSTTWTNPQRSRAEQIHDSNKRLLHTGVCRRLTTTWTTTDSGQHLQPDSTTFTIATNGNTTPRQHCVLSRAQHHQQRRPLWNFTVQRLHRQTTRGQQHVHMQPSSSTRDSIPEVNSISRTWATSINREACSFPQSRW